MLGLALGGGAAHGSWQAGRMRRLALKGHQWPIVAGASVGSINGAHLAQYPIGEEAQATRDLYKLWLKLRTKDVHRRWFPFGLLHSLWRKGVRDLRPLEKFLKKHLDVEKVRDSGRKLIVGAVGRAASTEKTWTEVDADVIVDAIMASCAIPYAFEPQKVDGVDHVDWGVRTVIPVRALAAAGCTEVEVIGCAPEIPEPAPTPKNALEAGLAQVAATTHQIGLDDLATSLVPLDVHRPKTDLGDSLDFEPETNAWRWELGAGDDRDQHDQA